MTIKTLAASALAALLPFPFIAPVAPSAVPVTKHCHVSAQWEYASEDESPDVRIVVWTNVGSQGVFMTCWEAWDRRKTASQIILDLREFNNGNSVSHAATARAANVVTMIWRTSAPGGWVSGQATVGRSAVFTEAHQ